MICNYNVQLNYSFNECDLHAHDFNQMVHLL